MMLEFHTIEAMRLAVNLDRGGTGYTSKEGKVILVPDDKGNYQRFVYKDTIPEFSPNLSHEQLCFHKDWNQHELALEARIAPAYEIVYRDTILKTFELFKDRTSDNSDFVHRMEALEIEMSFENLFRTLISIIEETNFKYEVSIIGWYSRFRVYYLTSELSLAIAEALFHKGTPYSFDDAFYLLSCRPKPEFLPLLKEMRQIRESRGITDEELRELIRKLEKRS